MCHSSICLLRTYIDLYNKFEEIQRLRSRARRTGPRSPQLALASFCGPGPGLTHHQEQQQRVEEEPSVLKGYFKAISPTIQKGSIMESDVISLYLSHSLRLLEAITLPSERGEAHSPLHGEVGTEEVFHDLGFDASISSKPVDKGTCIDRDN